LYGVGGEIARLEQNIRHARELQERQQVEFQETESALHDLEKHRVLDKAQVEDLTQSLSAVEPELRDARSAEEAAQEQLSLAETAVAEWQKQFEGHHQESTESNREADRTRAEIEVLDQRLLQASRRLEALQSEAESIDTQSLNREIETLQQESAGLASEEQDKQARLDTLRQRLADTQTDLRAAEERQREAQRELHTREGRLESLRAMQQAALEDETVADWLDQQGLASAPRLARVVEVEDGWEVALETVLGHWLQAVMVGQGTAHGQALAGLESSFLSLVEQGSGGVERRAGSLAEKVQAPDAVLGWLNTVRTAASLQQAWSARDALGEGESWITAGGEWIGGDWARVARAQTDQDSMLARERAIDRLDQQVNGLAEETAGLAGTIEEARSAAESLETGVQDLQAELNAVQRQGSVAAETGELRQQARDDQATVRKARGRLEGMVARMAGLKDERDGLEAQRGELLAQRDAARQAVAAARDRRHELALKAESRRASLDSLQQSLERMDAQLSQLHQRHLSLNEQIAQAQAPDELHRGEMDELLQRRVATETRLGEARAHLQSLENDYREQDAERQRVIQSADEIRQDLERARLQQQEIQLNARALQRQVEELGADVEELAAGLPEGADPAEWEAELQRLREAIVRLEPVNLAAIQEFEEEQKRKEYLDAQNDDLCDALATLENAIAKIDRRTRTRFKETFERVNKGVQELFPRLFGGGHAYLELTGEDLLTTGVGIMAQPPGKRVTSLHLLSGGVFAIFRLNPAPFCLLDEVDAPLDDANVVRFSSLVRDMSDAVQFVIVTHNKITMEMVHQMSGVTMREPGVSRLVQVDIDQAAALAGS
jgi:chromosome segregation protein